MHEYPTLRLTRAARFPGHLTCVSILSVALCLLCGSSACWAATPPAIFQWAAPLILTTHTYCSIVGTAGSVSSFDFDSLRRLVKPQPAGYAEPGGYFVGRARSRGVPALPAPLLHRLTLDRGPALPFSIQAPDTGTGFEAIVSSGRNPPEPEIGVGPDHMVITENAVIAVVDKDGSNRREVDSRDFFGLDTTRGVPFDHKCAYDPRGGRFLVVAVETGSDTVYLAISKTSNPHAGWWRYKTRGRLFGGSGYDPAAGSLGLVDYPGLGFSDNKVVVSWDMDAPPDYTDFATARMRVFDRDSVYAGRPPRYIDVDLSDPWQDADNHSGGSWPVCPGGASGVCAIWTTKPSRSLSAGTDVYLLALHEVPVDTLAHEVAFRKLTGTVAAQNVCADSTSNFSLARITTDNYLRPPAYARAPSQGQVNIDRDHLATMDFYVRNGVITTAWHVGATIEGGGLASAIRLLQIRTSDKAVLTDETYGSSESDYYYPAVCTDSAGSVYLGFTRSSTSEYASVRATGKRRSDATIEPSVLLKAGVCNVNVFWGDYTGISTDESASSSSGTSAWYAGEWAKTGGTCGTWARKLSFGYGQISGVVRFDADGDTSTTGDQTALAGVSVALKKGSTTRATTTTDSLGQYQFIYLDPETLDVVMTVPGDDCALAALVGTGATSQTRVSNTDIQVVLAGSQESSNNKFILSHYRVTLPLADAIWATGKDSTVQWVPPCDTTGSRRIGVYLGRSSSSTISAWPQVIDTTLAPGTRSKTWHVSGCAPQYGQFRVAYRYWSGDSAVALGPVYKLVRRNPANFPAPPTNAAWVVGRDSIAVWNAGPGAVGATKIRVYLGTDPEGAPTSWPSVVKDSTEISICDTLFHWTPWSSITDPCYAQFMLVSYKPGGTPDTLFSNQFEIGIPGCPLVAAWTGSQWVEDNTILKDAARPGSDVDRYLLRHAPAPQAGAYRLRILERERETSILDAVQLVVLDHAAGTTVGVWDTGEPFVVGEKILPQSAVDGAGQDRLAELIPGGGGVLANAGETITLRFDPARTAPAPAAAAASNSGGGGMQGYSYIKLPGAPARIGPRTAETARDLEGIGIEVPDGADATRWVEVCRIHPRELGSGFGVSRTTLRGSSVIRYRFYATHRLADVTWCSEGPGEIGQRVLGPQTALGGTVLSPGGTLELAFAAPPLGSGLSRDFLLVAKGTYTSGTQPARPLPREVAFSRPGPNPFRTGLTLRYALPKKAHVRLSILNVSGAVVAQVRDAEQDAGYWEATWDGRAQSGALVSAGIYFARFEAGSYHRTYKVTRMR
ncbi:MAG TPA: FlgD immunoglobulin-like domain containing protein [Candidatus Saccharimonadales bacterium]|nr:FlgD immunoglobulin-like domain containing protein [Candidatus Saccharimonadales bacterium]